MARNELVTSVSAAIKGQKVEIPSSVQEAKDQRATDGKMKRTEQNEVSR